MHNFRGSDNQTLIINHLPQVTNPIHFREYVYITSIATPSTSGDYYQVGGFLAVVVQIMVMEN